MFNLGVILGERGELEEAEAFYREAAEAGDADAMVNLAVVLEQRGEVEEADAWRVEADRGAESA